MTLSIYFDQLSTCPPKQIPLRLHISGQKFELLQRTSKLFGHLILPNVPFYPEIIYPGEEQR
jgi:hypothetical protein